MRDAEFLYVKRRAKISQPSTGILEAQPQKVKGSKCCRQALCSIHLLGMLSPVHGMNLFWNSKETTNRGIKCSNVECTFTELRASPSSIQTLNSHKGVSEVPESFLHHGEARASRESDWQVPLQVDHAKQLKPLSLEALEGGIVLNSEMLHLQNWLWGYTSPGVQHKS